MKNNIKLSKEEVNYLRKRMYVLIDRANELVHDFSQLSYEFGYEKLAKSFENGWSNIGELYYSVERDFNDIDDEHNDFNGDEES